MFTAVLFMITKSWKQLKCPSVDEGIRKPVVHPYNVIFFNDKIDDVSIHKKTWENLKFILINERNGSEKGYYLYDFNYMTFWKRLSYEN